MCKRSTREASGAGRGCALGRASGEDRSRGRQGPVGRGKDRPFSHQRVLNSRELGHGLCPRQVILAALGRQQE